MGIIHSMKLHRCDYIKKETLATKYFIDLLNEKLLKTENVLSAVNRTHFMHNRR